MLSSAKLFETAQSQLDHDRLMSIINNLTEGFLAISTDGRIEMSNGVALSLLDTNFRPSGLATAAQIKTAL
jgi:signal transduction histidine kinase